MPTDTISMSIDVTLKLSGVIIQKSGEDSSTDIF